MRGFYVSYDRNYSYVSIRGRTSGRLRRRVTLLVDGHRINDNIYESALIGTEFPIDVDLIDRVEVIRGPNSSQYIASAFLGVINVITKRGRDLPGIIMTEQAGSYRTFEDRASYGRTFSDGLEVLFSASWYRSHGNDSIFFPAFNAPGTNNGVAVNTDQDQSHQYFGNVSWRGLTVQGVYGSRDKQIPTASFATVFDAPGTQTTDKREYLDLTYDRNLWNGWSLTGRGYYDQYHNDGHYISDDSARGGPPDVLNIDFAHGNWWGRK